MPNILIVEDDPAVRDIVQIALEREGLSVEAVADGEAALKRFRSAGAFDLVLLDIMLPGIDGISLCQELRKSSDVPVVMLTARDGERSVVLGLEVGPTTTSPSRLARWSCESRAGPPPASARRRSRSKACIPRPSDRSSTSAGLGGRQACRPDRCGVRGSQVARRPSRMGL